MLLDVMDGADVRVIQRGGGLSFLHEAGLVLVGSSELRGKELQCDDAFKLCVFGFIHHAHPAFAELVENMVVRNRLSDHRNFLPGGRWNSILFFSFILSVLKYKPDRLDSCNRCINSTHNSIVFLTGCGTRNAEEHSGFLRE